MLLHILFIFMCKYGNFHKISSFTFTIERMRRKPVFQLVILLQGTFPKQQTAVSRVKTWKLVVVLDLSERVWCRIVFISSVKTCCTFYVRRWINWCFTVIFLIVFVNLKLCNNGYGIVEGKHFGTRYRKCYSFIKVTWTTS